MSITNIGLNFKTKTVRSYNEWQEVLRLYHESGLTISSFCKQNHISRSRLYYWLNKENSSIKLDSTKNNMSFARLVTQTTTQDERVSSIKDSNNITSIENNANISVFFPNGIIIKLPINYDTGLLINLIREMK